MVKRFLFFICLIACGAIGFAQNKAEESNLKAAFIYNFIKYIDWNADSAAEFSIGVIGPSPVYQYLQGVAATKTVNDKKIVVKHFDNPDSITFCNILFISESDPFSLSEVLAKIGRGTLIVSEEPGLAKQGTAFNFVEVRDKLKFEANVKSISSSGLKVSSRLLKLAKIVN
ncbi:MAG: YfiR family protein [Bacteroidota bacterium]|nr:YfiR family protein [Bacteroidota bacterium]